MSFVYITEHGCTLGVDGGLLIIRHTDGSEEFIPKELELKIPARDEIFLREVVKLISYKK